jgi:hypothetical protein
MVVFSVNGVGRFFSNSSLNMTFNGAGAFSPLKKCGFEELLGPDLCCPRKVQLCRGEL